MWIRGVCCRAWWQPVDLLRPALSSSAQHVEEVEKAKVEPKPAEPSAAMGPEDPQHILAGLLAPLDWSRFQKRRPGWLFDTEQGVLRCPQEHALTLCAVSLNSSRKSHQLDFMASKSACRECPLRVSCLGSVTPHPRKHVTMAVPKAAGDDIGEQLAEVQRARSLQRSAAIFAQPLPSGRLRRPPVGEPLAVRPPENDNTPGPWQISDAQFLPAAARAACRRASQAIVVHVTVTSPKREPPHPYLVKSPAQRQHRRLTWAERNARYALPDDAEVCIVFEGDRLLTATLGLGNRHEDVAA